MCGRLVVGFRGFWVLMFVCIACCMARARSFMKEVVFLVDFESSF